MDNFEFMGAPAARRKSFDEHSLDDGAHTRHQPRHTVFDSFNDPCNQLSSLEGLPHHLRQHERVFDHDSAELDFEGEGLRSDLPQHDSDDVFDQPMSHFGHQASMGGFMHDGEFDLFSQVYHQTNLKPTQLDRLMEEETPVPATTIESKDNFAAISEPAARGHGRVISPSSSMGHPFLSREGRSTGQSGELDNSSSFNELKFDCSFPHQQKKGQEVGHAKQSSSVSTTAALLSVEKQSSEEDKSGPTGAHSSSDQSDETCSDEDDAVYVPFEYQGDGRKREAKRHKLQTMVAKDEIEIDRMIRDYQNTNSKIIESEQALEELRTLKISKKELQSKRNRLTAQLSRDRQKLEMNFLKAMCVNYQRLLRRLDCKLADTTNQPFCQGCQQNLNSTMVHHRKNRTLPIQIELEAKDESFGIPAPVPGIAPQRPHLQDEDQTQAKRARKPSTETQSLSTATMNIKVAKVEKIVSAKAKRAEKIQAKSNKGQIAAATMLSVVGLLNYMGNGEAVCTSLDEVNSNRMPDEQFRVARVSEAKNDLTAESFTVEEDLDDGEVEDWTLEQDLMKEYNFAGELVPARPNSISSPASWSGNSILNRTSTGVTLEEAYVAYDMRESFLQRHASSMVMQADRTELVTKDFTTKSCNMWRTDDMALYPDQPVVSSCSATDSSNIYQDKYDHIEQNTNSMFCPTANLIVPFNNRSSTALMQHEKTTSGGPNQHDVILEKDGDGNTYLHLVLPATAVNFLNGSDGSSLFDFAEDSQMHSDYGEQGLDDVFVELGCKIFEVNKVHYRNHKGDPSQTVINASV